MDKYYVIYLKCRFTDPVICINNLVHVYVLTQKAPGFVTPCQNHTLILMANRLSTSQANLRT